MPEGKKALESLTVKLKESSGMNLFSIQNTQKNNYYKKSNLKFRFKKNKKGIIWAICVLFFVFSPLLFPIFDPIPEMEESLDVNNVEESYDGTESELLPDITLAFKANEELMTRKIPKIDGTRGFSGTSYPVGDWNINGTAIVWNETITLDGNLIVNETGSLTLINVTLKLNCGFNGEYRIEVLGGGELFIYDYDWDRFTEDDASNITAVNPLYKYLFWIQKDARFEMRNSELSWCGYEWGSNGELSGLWINTDNTIIDGNMIMNVYNGILVYEGNNAIIINNIISEGIQEQVSSSGFSVNAMGIFLSSNRDSYVYNNIIFNFTGKYWRGFGAGIYLTNTNNNTIIKNRIYNIKGGKGQDRSGAGVTGQIGGEGCGIYLFQSETSIINGNNISDLRGGDGGKGGEYGGPGGPGVGILLSSSRDLYIIDNNLCNNSGGNGNIGGGRGGQGGTGVSIALKSAFNIIIENNTILNNFRGLPGPGGELGYGCGIATNYYSYNTTVLNNTIVNSQSYDLYFHRDSHLFVINCSFNKNKIVFWESKSSLSIGWFLNVKVAVTDIPIHNALVKVKEISTELLNYSFLTQSDGFVRWIPLIEYVQNSKDKIFYSSYMVEASIESYMGNDTILMDRNRIIIINLDFLPITPFNITLHHGWNLISLPFIQLNTDLKEVLKPIEGKYDAVQYYNASDSIKPWKHYNATKPNHLNDLNSLDHKKGIWVHVNDSGNISFNIRGMRPTDKQTITLYCGWNLVGYPSFVDLPRDQALNNLNFGSDIDLIQYFNSSSKKWHTLESNDIMKMGMGYWFHTKSDLIWILNDTPAFIYNLNKDIYYYSLQEAINDANSYDTLEISPGFYSENVNINKSINIFGKVPGLIEIDGNGGVGFNISTNYVNLHNLKLNNCSDGFFINNSSNIELRNIHVDNLSSDGIHIENSNEINIYNISMNNNSFGIHGFNSSKILIFDSTINDQNNYSILLSNSNITLVNVSLNTYKINFFDTNSNLIIQWYLHVHTKDQVDYPIADTSVTVTDNNNGTFNNTYYTEFDGFVRRIRITQRIQDSTGNTTYTPHNISVYHPGFTFIENFDEIIINKSLTVTFISVNTVLQTPIHNVNRNRYYLTIQEAIDDANPADKIQLSSGIFSENIHIDKSLILIGESMDSTFINGSVEKYFNITSDGVIIKNLNIQNFTYGIFCNNSSPLVDHCIIKNNSYGVVSLNSSKPIISNITLENEIFDYVISESYLISLNTYFNTTKVKFNDSISNLTVQWFLHVQLYDAASNPIGDGNVWIMDNENGTYDMNFTTGSDGYVRWIVLTERIQNLSGNITFNPYWIEVSYWDPVVGWVNFFDNPRNISVNGSLFEIRNEIFTTPDIIPEFSGILIPLMATIASFVMFRRKKQINSE
jgi:hypothetical protein